MSLQPGPYVRFLMIQVASMDLGPGDGGVGTGLGRDDNAGNRGEDIELVKRFLGPNEVGA